MCVQALIYTLGTQDMVKGNTSVPGVQLETRLDQNFGQGIYFCWGFLLAVFIHSKDPLEV